MAAILPGIGEYKSSDDSEEDSTDVEEEVNGKVDLTGRQIIKKKVCDEWGSENKFSF